MTDHSLTPPPELVQQWIYEDDDAIRTSPNWYRVFAAKAARWGADAELEACLEWVSSWCGRWPDGTRPEDELRAARRPQKQPTLKELALIQLSNLIDDLRRHGLGYSDDTIRLALEQLPDDPAGTPPPEPAAAPGDRPLWEAMQAAHDKAATNRSGYAAELRAVADWLERKQQAHPSLLLSLDQVAHQLRTEADRAEAS